MPSKKLVLRFPAHLVDRPIIYRLVKDYDLTFNILKAQISPQEEGLLVFELSGEPRALESGISYLKGLGVHIQAFGEDVYRDEGRCTHCGVCVVMCPTGALSLDKETMLVSFDSSKCIACEACIGSCPPKAMQIRF